MTKHAAIIVALTLTALPAVAQTPTRSLTPPEVLGAASSIQFTATEVIGGVSEEVSTATLVQPNKAYVVDTNFKTKAIDTVYVSDGKTQTEYRASRARYTKSGAPVRIAEIDSRTVALATVTDFFDPKAFAKFQQAASDASSIYQMPLGTQDGRTLMEVLAINPVTGLPRSVSIEITPSKRPNRPAEQIIFSNWKLNTPIDDSKFAYTPPVTAHLYVAPQLLANGTQAPDFTVQDKDGKPVKLSDFKGKTVVLDFWATWCGPCQQSLPHTTKVAKEYADKNVVVLAVNVWDKAEAFQTWLPKHPEYAALNFAIDPNLNQDKSIATALYGVSGIPTQYVIDPSGKIIKSIVGYEEGSTDLEDALKGI